MQVYGLAEDPPTFCRWAICLTWIINSVRVFFLVQLWDEMWKCECDKVIGSMPGRSDERRRDLSKLMGIKFCRKLLDVSLILGFSISLRTFEFILIYRKLTHQFNKINITFKTRPAIIFQVGSRIIKCSVSVCSFGDYRLLIAVRFVIVVDYCSQLFHIRLACRLSVCLSSSIRTNWQS